MSDLLLRTATGVITRAAADASGPSRTIVGRATSYGGDPDWAMFNGWPARTAIEPGALTAGEPSMPVLLGHDVSRIVGVVRDLDDSDTELSTGMEMARTPAGDEALTLAELGALTGMSVGLDVHEYVQAADEQGEYVLVTRATIREISLTPFPADSSARVSSVTASHPEGQPMTSPVAVINPPAPASDGLTPDEIITFREHIARNASRLGVQDPGPELVPAAPGIASRAAAAMPTPGEWFTAYVRRSHPDTRDSREYDAIMRQVSGRDALQRAVADQTTGDTPGLMPIPIAGEVINLSTEVRPVYDSLTARPMPRAGKSFTRPRITQHVKVGAQTAEKAELVSQAMKVVGDPVNKGTVGGTLDVSFQEIDWTDPGAWNLLLADFSDVYRQLTESTAAAALEAAAAVAPVYTGASPDAKAIVKALYQAAANVYVSTKRMPNTIWVSPNNWALLGSLTDTAGQLVFPVLNPYSAAGRMDGITSFGGNPLGARFVVSYALSDDYIIVGTSTGFETYEDLRGLIQALNVTQLGIDIAYYGYTALYNIPAPATVAVGVSLTAAPPAPLAAKTAKTPAETPAEPTE